MSSNSAAGQRRVAGLMYARNNGDCRRSPEESSDSQCNDWKIPSVQINNRLAPHETSKYSVMRGDQTRLRDGQATRRVKGDI